ncbi:hypothetical protein [Caminibacter pacificus]|uniref:Uncharacterized protein n=1 Tax=Caminibacter pacificus TaxID=1424653 RepID=A0AAJ4RBA6_9BACT|nr:hypothetical protein [Caminibacter pacificus]QDD68174.1 hypothetical protein C6V80_09985 [Caminibacter pacificus]ROR38687.1 hypothetical protein EDC58_1902 [Caminibacter pacificus]
MAKLIIDPNDSKGFRFYLKTEEGETKLDKILQIEDGKLKTKITMDGVSANFITPATLALVLPRDIEEAKKVLEEHPEGVLYLSSITSESQYHTIDEIEIKDFKADFSNTKAKTELKAYETPERFFDFLGSLIEDEIKKRIFLEDNITKIETLIQKDKDFMGKITTKLQFVPIGQIKDAIKYLLNENDLNMSNFAEDYVKVAEEIKKEEKFFNLIEDLKFFLQKPLKELQSENVIQEIKKAKLTPLKIEKIGIFDPQAGSGKILDIFKNKGINSALLGTELRDIQNNDPDYKVITGVNFSIHKNVIKDVLESKKSHIPKNLIYYLNPPYTKDDEVAKDSIQSLPDNAFVMGLFPTKMAKFLKNILKGIIFEIPKELTGYNDSNAPENFLFIFGVKPSNNQLFSGAKYYKVDSYESIKKIIDEFLQDNYLVDSKLDEILTYYRAERNFDSFKNLLQKAIQDNEELYKNIERLRESISIDLIKEFFSPINRAIKGKVFQDSRFFVKDDKDEKKLSFFEVVQDLTLLNFYKNVMPETFKLIQLVAEKINYKLPHMEDNFRHYKLGDKYEGEKDLVTNKNLGMMKLYYYPDVIDISEQYSKDLLFKIVKEIAEDNKVNVTIDEEIEFKKLLQKADKLVFKNEKSISLEEGISYNNEVYVLTDKFGFDLAKLSCNVNDFFKKLQEYNLFNFDDFVDEVEISNEKLEKVISRFEEYMKNDVIDSILRFNFKIGTFEGFDEEAEFQEVKTKFIDEIIALKNKNVTQLLEFADKYKLIEFFQERIVFPDFKRQLKKEMDKTFPINNEEVKKKVYKFIVQSYENREITFFENERGAFFNELKKALKQKYEFKDEDYEDFILAVTDALTERYKAKRAIFTGYAKLALILKNYAKLITAKNFEEKKKIFMTDLFLKAFGLKPHQAKEAFNYLELSPNKKLEMLFWEMRAGKTRAMLAIGFLLSLYKNEKFQLLIETANTYDISQQILESFPFLFVDAGIYTPSGDLPLNDVYESIMYEEIIPNIPVYTQKYLIGKGDTADIIKKNFYKDFMEIKKLIDSNPDEYAKIYEKSDFAEILKVCRR